MPTRSYEVITFAEAVQKMGFHVYVLNMRGHGNAPLHREKKVGAGPVPTLAARLLNLMPRQGDPPTFNTISGCDDLREAIQFVLKVRPRHTSPVLSDSPALPQALRVDDN